jgi:hypothetical protein
MKTDDENKESAMATSKIQIEWRKILAYITKRQRTKKRKVPRTTQYRRDLKAKKAQEIAQLHKHKITHFFRPKATTGSNNNTTIMPEEIILVIDDPPDEEIDDVVDNEQEEDDSLMEEVTEEDNAPGMPEGNNHHKLLEL